MAFSYKAYPEELIGKKVVWDEYIGRAYVPYYGTIVKFLNNNKVRVAQGNYLSTRVFRECWGKLEFEPLIGDTVYGTSTRGDPDRINERGNHSSQLYWKGTVEEIYNDYVIVKMSVTGRLSKRTNIRPRL
jgi:hypothetical protein